MLVLIELLLNDYSLFVKQPYYLGLRVPEKLSAKSIKDEIIRPSYSAETILFRLFIFVS